MSDSGSSTANFLRRWSNRKRAAEPRAQETDHDPNVASAAAAFDQAILPPIESIGTASDIRAFLAPNVPIELQRAAVRQLWLSDPTIRDFIGIAENQWDFTKPDTVPGFGSLELTPELRRTVEELFGTTTEQTTLHAPGYVQQGDSVQSEGLPLTAMQNAASDRPNKVSVDENKTKSAGESDTDVAGLPNKCGQFS